MYKEILQALTTKYEGVNEQILSRVAKKLAETAKSEDEVTTAVEGVTFQQILESYGDSRATDAQKTAVTNYEKKYGLKEGKKVVEEKGKEAPQPEKEKDGDEMPAWAKAIIEGQKKLDDAVKTMKGEKVTETRKQKLSSIIKDLPETLRKGYERISVKDYSDDDFEQLITDVTSEVGAVEQEMKAKGFVFGKPQSDKSGGKDSADNGSPNKATEQEVKDAVARINV